MCMPLQFEALQQDDITEIKNHLAELKGEFVASKNSSLVRLISLQRSWLLQMNVQMAKGIVLLGSRERFAATSRLGLLLEIG